MKHVVYLFAFVCANTFAQCTIDGISHASCTITSAGTPPQSCGPSTCPSPKQCVNNACVTVAPANGCPYPIAGGDQVWGKVQGVSLFPQPAMSATGERGGAIQFILDAASFPDGVLFRIWDDNGSIGKEAVVSSCPHDFRPLNGQSACQSIGPIAPAIAMRYSGAGCIVSPGSDLYFNVRPNTPGYEGTTFIQIGASVIVPFGGFGGFGGF
jgi:hypothetical protein